MIYRDRREAGKRLARHLMHFAGDPSVVVLALPRGGVPVGFEIAEALAAPLDVLVVRKLGMPGHEEYAMGAVASGGLLVRNEEAVRWLGIAEETMAAVAAREREEVARRDRLYRGDRPPIDVRGRTVLLVDDGLATGTSMRVALEALRKQEPKEVIVAVPVGAADTCREIHQVADQVVCPARPEPFEAVGLWYDDFSQTTDAEVRELLERALVWNQPHAVSA